MTELYGIIPPATTPFDEQGDIQFDAVRAQINWLIDQGVQGIAVGGSTGEGHTLDAEETRELVAAATQAADRGVRAGASPAFGFAARVPVALLTVKTSTVWVNGRSSDLRARLPTG